MDKYTLILSQVQLIDFPSSGYNKPIIILLLIMGIISVLSAYKQSKGKLRSTNGSFKAKTNRHIVYISSLDSDPGDLVDLLIKGLEELGVEVVTFSSQALPGQNLRDVFKATLPYVDKLVIIASHSNLEYNDLLEDEVAVFAEYKGIKDIIPIAMDTSWSNYSCTEGSLSDSIIRHMVKNKVVPVLLKDNIDDTLTLIIEALD